MAKARKFLSLVVPAELAKLVEQAAEKRRLSKSAVVREILYQVLSGSGDRDEAKTGKSRAS